MGKIDKKLVELFCAKACVVGATIYEAPSMEEAINYIIKICESKTPCEILATEKGTEHGPLSENNVPTRLERIIAAPNLSAEFLSPFKIACQAKGFLCLESGLHKYLAGIDLGIAEAELGVAASATCMLHSENEDARLATMISEICVIFLKKSRIFPDLPSIAPILRLAQSKQTSAYTAFITGPSRTSDIERVPAVGVHGPLEQHIILLED